jgi:hypothetical protein
VRELEILWQRVTVGAETCLRCGDTGESVRRAAEALQAELGPSGVAVRLVEKALPPFAVNESNRVFFNGRALEDILGARVGMNPCRSCCELLGAETDCRTLILDGRVHEALPEELLLRAGRLAAQDLE